MKLSPKTVYIPTKIVSANSSFFKSDDGGSGYLEQKNNHYCLSKQDLIELISDVFDAGQEYGNPHLEGTPDTKEHVINNIIDNE